MFVSNGRKHMLRAEELAHWINAREYIRFHKESGSPPPWTRDPILANHRWCNVRREDDKVTRWIRENWSWRYGGQHPNILLAMVAARFINRIESLEALGFPEEPSVWLSKFYTAAAGMRPFWGNAYTISTCGARMGKPEYVGQVFASVQKEQVGFERKLMLVNECQNAHALLTEIYGLGDFLAAQVVADLKWTPDHPLETAQDRLTWAAPGPGSRRGLDRFDGRSKAPGGGGGGWLGRLHRAAAATRPLIDPYLWNNNLHKMDMQDWQNCMCEFDKYCRLQEGGHVRNKYVPRG